MRENLRESFEIMEEILNITKGGSNKTNIIYSANLNHSRASKYLEEMMDKGLIDTADNSTSYRTTDKGRVFLEKYKEIKEIING